MNRDLYDEDHEAFRASVREFLNRSVIPHVEEYAEAHAIPREVWLEAGKQGFLGLAIPRSTAAPRRTTTGSTPSSGRSWPRSTRRSTAAGVSKPTSRLPTSSSSAPRSRSCAGSRGSRPARSCSQSA